MKFGGSISDVTYAWSPAAAQESASRGEGRLGNRAGERPRRGSVDLPILLLPAHLLDKQMPAGFA